MSTLTMNKLYDGLRLPVLVAPMFLVSSEQSTVEASRAGLIGTYLAPNSRTISDFSRALTTIKRGVADRIWAVSMIVHKSYTRCDEELELIQAARPPLVISALGDPSRVVPAIHAYGGAVFTDVVTPEQARNCVDAGIDGLILLCSGAGGHTGTYSPMAFVEEVRDFWSGPIVLGGAIGSARGIRAALELGADFAYMGTRFLAAHETNASEGYKEMIVNSSLTDIVLSSEPTGLPANWLRVSLEAAGFNGGHATPKKKADFSDLQSEVKAWKNIWSAGQSVGRTGKIESITEIADLLVAEYSYLSANSQLPQWPDRSNRW